jgi:hypothetical protein
MGGSTGYSSFVTCTARNLNHLYSVQNDIRQLNKCVLAFCPECKSSKLRRIREVLDTNQVTDLRCRTKTIRKL